MSATGVAAGGSESAGPVAAARARLDAADATDDALAALDAAAYGFDRRVDHAHWRRHARLTVWSDSGAPAAYSYVWPHGRIGPIAGRDGDAAANALRAELERADAQAGVIVPGSARRIVEAALQAGLRFAAPPGLLLLSEHAAPPTALAVSSYSLF